MILPFPLKPTTHLAATALALVLASCSREEATPSPEAGYSRTIVYLDQASPARHDTAYQAPALQVKAVLKPTACTIQLQPATQQEALSLSIPRAQLAAGFTGSYSFQVPATAGQAPGFNYAVNKPDKPLGGDAWAYWNGWLPTTGAAAGEVEITSYDAKRHLLGGRFRLALTSVHDPRALSTEFRPRRCNLTLAGTFANVPLADVD